MHSFLATILKHRVYCTGCVNRSSETTVSHKCSEQYYLFSFSACPRRLHRQQRSVDNRWASDIENKSIYPIQRLETQGIFPQISGDILIFTGKKISRIHNHIRHNLRYIYFKFNTSYFLKNYTQYKHFLHYLNIYILQ